jgi:hypothetical protein
VAVRIVTYRVVWLAIDLFAPYKSPGMDRIFQALLQEGQGFLISYVDKIFRPCMAMEALICLPHWS